MPKICEVCKQPYDDKLTMCPNCDIVDIGGTLPPAAPAPAAAPKAPAKPGEELPPTKVQGPIPPVGGSVRPPSVGKPGQTPAAPPAAPPSQSPLMAKAMEGTAAKPQAAQGKATNLPSGTQGQPTMVAPQTGQPTQVAKQSSQPTMVAKQQSPPTMIAPEGAMPAEAGAAGKPGTAAKPGTGAKPPVSVEKVPTTPAKPQAAVPGKGQAQPTMLPKGAAQPTQVAKQSSPPTMLAPEGAAAAEAAAGLAKKTQMPQGAKMPTQLQKRGDKTMIMPPEEAPGAEAAPVDPKKTMLPKGVAQPTMLAKATEPTKLAPEGTEGMELPEGYGPTGDPKKKTQMPQGAKMPTMLAQPQSKKTTLDDASAQPMDLPDSAKKKTMLARGADPTKLGADTEALPLPEGYDSPKKTVLPPGGRKTVMDDPNQAPLDIPGKKTVLPGVAKKTVMDDPGTDPLALPGKKTAMPGPAQPTTLVPPEEAEPMQIPGGDIAQSLEQQPEPSVETMKSVDMGLESSTKYDTAPPIKPGYKKRWFGGIVIGLLLGFGILAILWTMKEDDPVRGWLEAIGLRPLRPDPTSLEQAMQWLDEGKIRDAFLVLEKMGDDPRVQGVRGEARWFMYLQKNKGTGDINDGELQLALRELEAGQKCDDPTISYRATVFPGNINLQHGDPNNAVKVFDSGMAKYKDKADPFKAGVSHSKGYPGKATDKPPVEKPAPAEKDKGDAAKEKGGQAMANPNKGNLTEDEALEIMALLLVAQQSTPAPPVNVAKGEPEAGVLFWEAVRLAQEGNYSDAAKKLQEARDRHNEVRFSRLKKAQNPLTDPTEAIFLKSADDMRVYWRILEKLKGQKLDLKDPVAAVDNLIKSTMAPDKALLEIAKELGIKSEKPTVGDVITAIQGLGMDKRIGDAVRKALADNKVLNEEQLKDAKEVETAAMKFVDGGVSNIKIAELIKDAKPKIPGATTDEAVKNLINDYFATLNTANKMLADNQYIEDGPYEKKKFLDGLNNAIEAAKSPLVAALGRTLNGFTKFANGAPNFPALAIWLQSQLDAEKLKNQVLEGRLANARSSRQMLEFWLPVVSKKEEKDVRDVLKWASQDARHVLDDKLATPTDKAAALSISGMASRIDGKFDDARTALNDAVKTGKGDNEGKWRGYAIASLKELTDPAAYYLPRGEALQLIGNYNQALDVLNAGVGAFPNDGRVLALRAVVILDQARSTARAPLTLASPQVAAARKDAEAAVAAGARGDGNYALGRVFEDINDPVAAEAAYRRALEANPGNPAGSRYRVALGRVMLKMNPLPGSPPVQIPAPPAINRPAANKVGQLPSVNDEQTKLEIQMALVLAVTGLVDDEETPDLDTIIRLADQAIKAKNYEGYLIKAGALARKGQWTEALKLYSEGLRYLIPDNYSRGLSEIVNNHPAFNLPDPLRNPDPLRAERHFSAGLRFYFAGMYPQAEQEFTEAYRNQGQDARILYYLGLSKLPQQGKRQAAVVNFQMASILEQQNKPSPAAVNASLERVQGELRRYLSAYRP